MFIISERDYWIYTYSDNIGCISSGGCGTWKCPGYTGEYYERAALYSLSVTELNSIWSLMLMLNLIGISYVILTNFGKLKNESSVIENLDKENEIIKKRIEKQELLAKLENLEKK